MGFVFVLVFLGLFMLGFPVVYAILLPAAGYVLIEGLPLGLLAQRVTYALDSFPLVAVPLFIFVGNLMNLSGITDRIFRFAYTLVGRVPGGLAQVNVFGSLIFSGMSGAALADIGGLGRIEIDAMKKRGFDPSFAGAVTASSATIGPIFPPSIPLIVYGSVTSVSIVQLLVAGIMPAIVCTLFLMLTVLVIALWHGHPRAERWSTAGEVLKDFIPALPAIIAPVLMIGGMMLGAFTPTEAAAVAVVYAILVGRFVYGDLAFSALPGIFLRAGGFTAGIMILVGGATVFNWLMAVEGLPDMVAGWIKATVTSPWAFLLAVNVFLMIFGMPMESIAMILLLSPVILKAAVGYGLDPVHVAVVFVFNSVIGMISPPFGGTLFVAAIVARRPISAVTRHIYLPWAVMTAVLLLITYVPSLVLALPRAAGFLK
jgi:tripartite ATP-independent transporter DctM subunit